MDELKHDLADNILNMAADLVAAYVSNNNVPVTELAALLSSVHAALAGLGNEASAEPVGPEKPTPAQIRKSITPDALISFLDGKPYKSIKRHLTKHGLTFEEYRARYGLPSDYLSTSANYSAKRSELARSFGLGQQHRKAAPKATATAETITEATKPLGRPRKAAASPEDALKARGRKKADETA